MCGLPAHKSRKSMKMAKERPGSKPSRGAAKAACVHTLEQITGLTGGLLRPMVQRSFSHLIL